MELNATNPMMGLMTAWTRPVNANAEKLLDPLAIAVDFIRLSGKRLDDPDAAQRLFGRCGVSASASCACRLIRRTQRPSTIIPITAMGTIASIIRVICHDITKMMMQAANQRDRLRHQVQQGRGDRILDGHHIGAQSGDQFPIRVLAKKRSGIRCKWP